MSILVSTNTLFKQKLLDFPLSRRESTVSYVNYSHGQPSSFDHTEISQKDFGESYKRPSSAAPKLDWMGDLKKTHEKFTFTPTSELTAKSLQQPSSEKKKNITEEIDQQQPPQQHVHLFSEEADPIKQMIKKIMYAEGDMLSLNDECAIYLKDALQVLQVKFCIISLFVLELGYSWWIWSLKERKTMESKR